MNLEILSMLIEKRNKAIDKEYIKKPSFEYIKDTRDNINDDKKVLVSYLSIATNKPIEECEKIINGLKTTDVRFTEAEFTVIIDFLINLRENSSLKYVKEFFQTNSLVKEIMYWKKMELDSISKANITVIKSLVRRHKVDLIGLLDLLEKDYDTFLEISNIIINCKEKNNDLTIARAKKALYAKMREKKENGITSRKDDRAKKLNLEEAKQKIKRYVENIESEEKNHYKQIKLEKYYNEQALETLEKELQKREITNIRPLIKKIVDPQIKEIILLIIYKHNLSYMQDLKQEYERLNSNSTTRYLSLLHEHGVTAKEEDLTNIKNNKIEDVEEILNNLKLLNISNELYLDILKITNKQTTEEIKELVVKGFISKTILSNIEIFNSDSKILNIIKNNILIFNKYQVNPTLFKEIEDILLVDNDLLDRVLNILESYNLTKSIKNSTNFNFLFNENINIVIDKYLELGYEKLLEEDLDILNYQDTRRLEILHNMGYELTKDEIIDMYEYDKFFIPDELLDSYIPSTVSYFYNDDIELTLDELMEYKKTNRTLEINGHLISINKVLKELESGKNLKESLFKNMNIDITTYEAIEKDLKGHNYTK